MPTGRESGLGKASWLRLIVTVDDQDSLEAVERVRAALETSPVPDATRPVFASHLHWVLQGSEVGSISPLTRPYTASIPV